MHRSGASWVLRGRCLTPPVSRHSAPEYGPEHCELRPEEPHLHRAQPQGRPLQLSTHPQRGWLPRAASQVCEAARASLNPSHPSLPGLKPLYAEGLCMGKGLGRVALGPQGK